MELYYHVLAIKSGKTCLFDFCFYGGPGRRITGRVCSRLSGFPKKQEFDPGSGYKLRTPEKEYIIKTVLKNIVQ